MVHQEKQGSEPIRQRLFEPGGVSRQAAIFSGWMLQTWLYKKLGQMQSPTPDTPYRHTVNSIQVGNRELLELVIDPSPCGEGGPYRPELIADLAKWAMASSWEGEPDPADYLVAPDQAVSGEAAS